ncbi:MAG: DNA translocase FtsK [Candidatus Omnitrophica bacterium]|nr:DNA translocase FtsK [Candidatus Omnitrophota bacterium]
MIKHPLTSKLKAVFYIGLAIFILLSLVFYSADDTPFRSSHPNIPVQNPTGIIGAYLAEGMHFCLGWAAYLVCLLLLVWAAARILQRPSPRFYIKILATAVFLLSITVLLALFGSQQQAPAFERAGVAGSVVAGFLVKYFGRAGALIIAIGLGGLASFIASEFLILPAFKRLVNFLLCSVLRLKKSPSAKERIESSSAIKTSLRPTITITEPKPIEPSIGSERSRPKIITPRITKPVPEKTQLLAEASKQKQTFGDYNLPTLDLLTLPPPLEDRQINDDLEANSRVLEATLRDFNVETRVTEVTRGPVITRYEIEPAPGVKIHRIVELGDDIALAMKAFSVRIVAPIPGKSRVGVEVPNSQSVLVYLREILSGSGFQHSKSKLTLALGKDISGEPLITDLADMPHLLIAGTTGAGKTVCVNSIITSMLFNASPDEIKFVMVDPKMVELAIFNDLPHLLCPVLTEPKKVAAALAWVVNEMEDRYRLLAKIGARNIDLYNQKISAKIEDEPLEKMPYIIIIIDELADLMVVVSQAVENAITRLAQLSRAVGIHLILATQRPSVDVITGVIKANFPARISFRVASKVDSRTVLDMNGADKLLGKGDLLFLKPGQHKPVRAQGTLISDADIEKIVGFIKAQRPSAYNQQLLAAQEKKNTVGKKFEKDELFDEAIKVIMQTKQASVSMLQRRLGLGYTRAARLIDMMEEEGIVGPYRGSKPREILIESEDGYIQESEKEQESV